VIRTVIVPPLQIVVAVVADTPLSTGCGLIVTLTAAEASEGHDNNVCTTV
jgi:hypothetical protein